MNKSHEEKRIEKNIEKFHAVVERIKSEQQEKKLLQKDIAKKTDISEGTYSKMMNFRQELSQEFIIKFGKSYNIDLNYLLTGNYNAGQDKNFMDIEDLFNLLNNSSNNDNFTEELLKKEVIELINKKIKLKINMNQNQLFLFRKVLQNLEITDKKDLIYSKYLLESLHKYKKELVKNYIPVHEKILKYLLIDSKYLPAPLSKIKAKLIHNSLGIDEKISKLNENESKYLVLNSKDFIKSLETQVTCKTDILIEDTIEYMKNFKKAS